MNLKSGSLWYLFYELANSAMQPLYFETCLYRCFPSSVPLKFNTEIVNAYCTTNIDLNRYNLGTYTDQLISVKGVWVVLAYLVDRYL